MLLAAIFHGRVVGRLRPVAHGLVAELARSLDHQRLDLVGAAKGLLGTAALGDAEDGFKLFEQLGMVFEPVHECLESSA